MKRITVLIVLGLIFMALHSETLKVYPARINNPALEEAISQALDSVGVNNIKNRKLNIVVKLESYKESKHKWLHQYLDTSIPIDTVIKILLYNRAISNRRNGGEKFKDDVNDYFWFKKDVRKYGLINLKDIDILLIDQKSDKSYFDLIKEATPKKVYLSPGMNYYNPGPVYVGIGNAVQFVYYTIHNGKPLFITYPIIE